MEHSYEQLKDSFSTFIDASQTALHELRENVAELKQNNTRLQQKSDLLEAEQQKSVKKLNAQVKHTDRRIGEQQTQLDEQRHLISQLQAENVVLKSKLVQRTGFQELLPSTEATPTSQDVSAGADATPRSSTFAGDEASPMRLPTEWLNLAIGTPVASRANGSVAHPQAKRKRRVTFSEPADATATFKIPPLPTRNRKTYKARTEMNASAPPIKPAKPAPADDVTNSAMAHVADTPMDDTLVGYDSENIIVTRRTSNASISSTTNVEPSATTSHVNKTHSQRSSSDPLSLSGDISQSEEDASPFISNSETQESYTSLIQQFNTRTGAMQVAAPTANAISEVTAEMEAFGREGERPRLRKNPRKSAFLVRQENEWEG